MDFITLIILMFVIALLTEVISKANRKSLKDGISSIWKYIFPYFYEEFKGVGRFFSITIHLILTIGAVLFVNRILGVGDLK